MMYIVRLKDEIQGRYREFQVAMNHAQGLIDAMEEIEEFNPSMVTVNGKPYNQMNGGY